MSESTAITGQHPDGWEPTQDDADEAHRLITDAKTDSVGYLVLLGVLVCLSLLVTMSEVSHFFRSVTSAGKWISCLPDFILNAGLMGTIIFEGRAASRPGYAPHQWDTAFRYFCAGAVLILNTYMSLFPTNNVTVWSPNYGGLIANLAIPLFLYFAAEVIAVKIVKAARVIDAARATLREFSAAQQRAARAEAARVQEEERAAAEAAREAERAAAEHARQLEIDDKEAERARADRAAERADEAERARLEEEAKDREAERARLAAEQAHRFDLDARAANEKAEREAEELRARAAEEAARAQAEAARTVEEMLNSARAETARQLEEAQVKASEVTGRATEEAERAIAEAAELAKRAQEEAARLAAEREAARARAPKPPRARTEPSARAQDKPSNARDTDAEERAQEDAAREILARAHAETNDIERAHGLTTRELGERYGFGQTWGRKQFDAARKRLDLDAEWHKELKQAVFDELFAVIAANAE